MTVRKTIMIRPRVYIGENLSIGPGKIDLLREIEKSQSITAAARAMNMPYKRARFLLESLNQGFGHPVVETITGGKNGGGATLTALGQNIVKHYLTLETCLNSACHAQLDALHNLAN
ncbi:MAG: hypothetical protein RIT27_652 [Pseudomonadota bacterium]|jgi:molybdate transport system regulatory protein